MPEKLVVPATDLVDSFSTHRGFQEMGEMASQLSAILESILADHDCSFDRVDIIKENVVIPLVRGMVEMKFAGIKKGYWTFAWWKDGVEYVGSSGKTLKEAIAELDIEENKFLSMIEGRKVT